MSRMLSLFCYVLGTDASNIFCVHIEPSQTISDLRRAIKAEKSNKFRNVDADELLLWKVTIAVDDINQKSIDAQRFEDAKSLSPVKKLSGLFADPPLPEHVHIVVKPPPEPVPPTPVQKIDVDLKVTSIAVIEGEEDDEVKEMWKGFDTVFANPGMGKTPSQNVKSSQYRLHQNAETRILDGRYAEHPNTTLAPPIELYHHVFAEFKAHLSNSSLELPPDVVSYTVELMEASSEIVSKEEHRSATRGLLSKLCSLAVDKVQNGDKTSPDHVSTISRNTDPIETALIAVFEEKSELGVNGDPSVQSAFSYVRYWADSAHKGIREACCCPSFIVGIAGPWIVILGGVITNFPIVQRLTDYIWLGHSRVIDDSYAFRVARIFYSLRLAMQSLRDYYLNLVPPPVEKAKMRFFPCITSYRVADQTIQFRYQRPLERNESTCVAFLARQVTNDKLVVVKFVERYGEEAHKLLSSKNLAPELFYYGPLTLPEDTAGRSYGNIRMVVMEYIEGHTAAQKYNNTRVPATLKRVVQKALRYLSERALVHGDLRKPNIMIPNDGGEEKTMIIDFDWAGKAGKVRYPLHLSNNAGWVDGVKDYELIQADHDVEMVNCL